MPPDVSHAIMLASKLTSRGDLTLRNYTHWLVTKGRDKDSVGRHGLVPIVLVHKADVSLRRLREITQAAVEARATTFLADDASEVARLGALAGAYARATYNNLWVSEVGLTSGDDALLQFNPLYEHATTWALALAGERLPPWQGPADGVIPREMPITIRLLRQPPQEFKIIDA